jgi:hypothetical protein
MISEIYPFMYWVVFWRTQELGKALESYFLPVLVVLGLVIGGYAANTYNEGATVFVKP